LLKSIKPGGKSKKAKAAAIEGKKGEDTKSKSKDREENVEALRPGADSESNEGYSNFDSEIEDGNEAEEVLNQFKEDHDVSTAKKTS